MIEHNIKYGKKGKIKICCRTDAIGMRPDKVRGKRMIQRGRKIVQ